MKAGNIMKIYHICEFCSQVFATSEVEGPDGAVELQGICDDCAGELGFNEQPSLGSYYYYN